MQNRVFFIFLCLFIVSTSYAQQKPVVEEAGVLYRKEGSVGILIHTRGFGIGYRNGTHITGKRKRILEFDLVSMHHPKEVKTLNQYYDKTRSFVYGKMNNVTVLRAGIGLQNILYQKDELGNIEIRYSFYGGATFGFAKPVYLYILEDSNDPYTPIKVIERYDPNKHPINVIYGKSPLGYGIEKTIIHPGIYAKASISFDWATDDEKTRSLEVGIAGDYYVKPIEMMAFNKATSLFTTFYGTISFGRKWN